MRLRAAVWWNKALHGCTLYAFARCSVVEQGLVCICVLLGVRRRCMSLRAAALCIGSLNHFLAMLKGENWLEWLLGGGM